MTLVVLILMAIFADHPGVVMEEDLVLPDGTTLADCQTAKRPDIPDGATWFGWKCAEIELSPTSSANGLPATNP